MEKVKITDCRGQRLTLDELRGGEDDDARRSRPRLTTKVTITDRDANA